MKLESVDKRHLLLQQCLVKVIDVSIQAIGPADMKHTLPDYKDIGASIDGALMKAIGPNRDRLQVTKS